MDCWDSGQPEDQAPEASARVPGAPEEEAAEKAEEAAATAVAA